MYLGVSVLKIFHNLHLSNAFAQDIERIDVSVETELWNHLLCIGSRCNHNELNSIIHGVHGFINCFKYFKWDIFIHTIFNSIVIAYRRNILLESRLSCFLDFFIHSLKLFLNFLQVFRRISLWVNHNDLTLLYCFLSFKIQHILERNLGNFHFY